MKRDKFQESYNTNKSKPTVTNNADTFESHHIIHSIHINLKERAFLNTSWKAYKLEIESLSCNDWPSVNTK